MDDEDQPYGTLYADDLQAISQAACIGLPGSREHSHEMDQELTPMWKCISSSLPSTPHSTIPAATSSVGCWFRRLDTLGGTLAEPFAQCNSSASKQGTAFFGPASLMWSES